VEVYSGRHVVDIDFEPLALKSDRKEGGGFLGNQNLKFKSLHFHNINTLDISTQTILILIKRNNILKFTHMCPFLTPLSSEIEVNMNLMPPVDVLFIQPPGLELSGLKL
jgi:hypothetical protein